MVEFVDTSGNFGDMTGAPESISSLVASKGFKSVEDLANGYKTEVAFKGTFAEKLNIPTEITDEMTAEMRTRMGVPSEITGYDLGESGGTMKPEALEAIKKMALEQGMTSTQIKAGVELINEIGNAQQQEVLDIALKSEEEMKAEMGDKFQPYLDGAIKAAEKIGMLDILNDTGLIARKDVLEKLNNVNNLISEDVLKTSTTGDPPPTKEELRKKLEANPALMNRMDPDHAKVVEEWLATMAG